MTVYIIVCYFSISRCIDRSNKSLTDVAQVNCSLHRTAVPSYVTKPLSRVLVNSTAGGRPVRQLGKKVYKAIVNQTDNDVREVGNTHKVSNSFVVISRPTQIRKTIKTS